MALIAVLMAGGAGWGSLAGGGRQGRARSSQIASGQRLVPPALDAVRMGAQGDGVGVLPVPPPGVGCSVLPSSSSSLESVMLLPPLSRRGAWMCCSCGAHWPRVGVSLWCPGWGENKGLKDQERE